jgi:DNA-binding MarR family transcriptional regulator
MQNNTSDKQEINDFLVNSFNHVLNMHEKALDPVTGGLLSIKDIHFIEAVIKSKAVGENCFSVIASMLGVTIGTLTSAFIKLESKGYLYKEQDQEDKRIFYIMPTELAETVDVAHQKFHNDLIDGIIAKFPPEDVAPLASGLRVIKKHLGMK